MAEHQDDKVLKAQKCGKTVPAAEQKICMAEEKRQMQDKRTLFFRRW